MPVWARPVPVGLADRSSHEGGARRRSLSNTQVSGDVSGWAAMTQATRMCVQQRRHGACMGAPAVRVCVADRRSHEGGARRRKLHNTQVTGCSSLTAGILDCVLVGKVSIWWSLFFIVIVIAIVVMCIWGMLQLL